MEKLMNLNTQVMEIDSQKEELDNGLDEDKKKKEEELQQKYLRKDELDK